MARDRTVFEEIGNAGPRLRAAVEAPPLQPHPADQLVAGVDGHQEVLDLPVPAVAPADQRGLDVGHGLAEQRMLGGQPLPGPQVKHALGGPGGTGVKADDPAGGRAVKEEGQAHGDLQLVELRRGQRALGVLEVAVGDGPVAHAGGVGPGEQEVAGAAGAFQGLVFQVGDMAMLGRELDLRSSSQRSVSGAGAGEGTTAATLRCLANDSSGSPPSSAARSVPSGTAA